MQTIDTVKIPQITGNSNATNDRPANGFVVGVYIAYAVTPNANTIVTLATPNNPPKTILTTPTNATSKWFYPNAIMMDESGAPITFDGSNEIYGRIPVADYLKATVTGGDADQTVDVWVLVESD